MVGSARQHIAAGVGDINRARPQIEGARGRVERHERDTSRRQRTESREKRHVPDERRRLARLRRGKQRPGRRGAGGKRVEREHLSVREAICDRRKLRQKAQQRVAQKPEHGSAFAHDRLRGGQLPREVHQLHRIRRSERAPRVRGEREVCGRHGHVRADERGELFGGELAQSDEAVDARK